MEQQPPYAGFDANSRASVSLHPTRPGYAVVRFVARTSDTTITPKLPTGWAADPFPTSTIRPGDVIEISGTRYELVNDSVTINDPLATVTVDSNGYYSMSSGPSAGGGIAQIIVKPVNDSGQQILPRYDRDGYEIGSKAPPVPSPYWTFPSPYKVLRQPTPTSDEPYQLPEGAAIDLRASGVGTGDFFYWPGIRDNSENVIIMFAPEGRVSRVAFSQLPLDSVETSDVFDKSVVDNIYLLIGRRENIPAPDATNSTADPTLNSTEWAKLTTDDDRARRRLPLNWLGGSSRWIVIGSQSGRIATIENAFVDPAAVMASPQAPYTSASQSSEQMRAAQILAAREFTHEMAQLGGR